MLRTIKYILYLMFMLPFIAGCSEDLYLDKATEDVNEELPIEFDFMLPDTPTTRGFDEGTDIKTAFANENMIHVFATFKTQELQEDGEYIQGELSRYGALKYSSAERKWEHVEGSNMKWPSVAVDGTFTAYYISGSDGVLTDITESKTYLLSDITPATDPLKAQSAEIKYGHAVELRFNHICTHLTLIDLEPQVATSYWFKRDDVTDFSNAFRLVLEKDANNDPTSLEVEFLSVPDNDFNNLVYISSLVTGATINDEGKEKTITKANYFLEPGLYKTFSLCYPATKPEIYNYLQYDYDKIPAQVGGKENTPPDFEAGKTYTLTVTKSSGVTINSPSSGEGWDDSDDYIEVDVEEFLKAIYERKAYKKDGVLILEQTASGTKLLHNVDFGNCDYSEEFKDKNFVPHNLEGSVFDGDYHYIRNLGSPLFRYNYGTIQNVGIRDIKFEAVSYEDDDFEDHNKDMSRYGALCMWNRQSATINNVRVIDVDMTVSVKSQVEIGSDGSETHNIGCVIGSNTGRVSEVALGGNFKLHVKGEEGYPVNASVLIGGFVGQNASQGNIYDISPLESNTISITNECVGSIGSYSVGGIVGESSGIITGVILSSVTIDGSKSQGVVSYMGGIAGKLEVSENLTSTSTISSCNISGSVTAGKTAQNGNLSSVSYIGGIVGADLDVPVTDCRTAVSVHGSQDVNENVVYAVGGAFGRIRKPTLIENIIAYGSALSGSNNATGSYYIGNFAGIVPKDQTWEKDYSDKNIIVRSFGYNPLGAALEDNNQ